MLAMVSSIRTSALQIAVAVRIFYRIAPVTMCYVTGNDFTYGDHTDHDAGDGNYSPMGSIMVLPGCTAYLFKDYDYKGKRFEWRASVINISHIALPMQYIY